MRVILSGGGTAGHVNPAVAIAEEILFRDKNSEVLFIGREGGGENASVVKLGLPIKYLKVRGLERRLTLRNFEAIRLAIKAKSVLPCLVAHFINNFAILLLEYLKVSIDLYNGVTIALGLMLLAVFWTGIILHKRSVNTFAYKEITLTPTHGFTYGIVAIMIYVVLMIANLFA